MSRITTCRVCKSRQLKTFFNLGNHPLANSLLKSPTQEEKFYPLALTRCDECTLVQLTYTIDPKILFSRYVWITGTSRTAKEFANTFFKNLISRTKSAREGYILEIASNDGTFLKPFIRDKYKVLGIDPAENIVKIANKEGVPTKNMFLGINEAKKIVSSHGRAKAIFARNVLAHVASANDFVKGLSFVLDEDGTVAIEVHYAGEILKGLQYDSIYHEHLCYFTFKSLECLLNQSGLFIFDVLESPISGGAIIVYARKVKKKETYRVKEYRKKEIQEKANLLITWEKFAERAIIHREKFISLLDKVNKHGEVIGWGASARSSTLLNFCKIGPERISVLVDMNVLKQGKYTAGTHIPILSPDKVISKNTAFVCILGWNFSKEIIGILRKNFGIRDNYIIPLPVEPKLISQYEI